MHHLQHTYPAGSRRYYYYYYYYYQTTTIHCPYLDGGYYIAHISPRGTGYLIPALKGLWSQSPRRRAFLQPHRERACNVNQGHPVVSKPSGPHWAGSAQSLDLSNPPQLATAPNWLPTSPSLHTPRYKVQGAWCEVHRISRPIDHD